MTGSSPADGDQHEEVADDAAGDHQSVDDDEQELEDENINGKHESESPSTLT